MDSERSADQTDAASEANVRVPSGPVRHRDQDGRKTLAGIIQNDIIPTLVHAHERALARAQAESKPGLTPDQYAECIEEFTEVVIHEDINQSFAYFEFMRCQGATIEELFNHLLAPTARRLGDLWDRDIRDFTEVTRGVDHIQQLVLSHCSAFCSDNPHPNASRRVLLMPLPGERHGLGVCIVRAHFWREGWDVWCDAPETMKDLAALVRMQWFDVIGISASRLNEPERLARDLRAVRKASLNPGLMILVGGQAFTENPDRVAAVGADATASDGRAAVSAMSARLNQGRRPA